MIPANGVTRTHSKEVGRLFNPAKVVNDLAERGVALIQERPTFCVSSTDKGCCKKENQSSVIVHTAQYNFLHIEHHIGFVFFCMIFYANGIE